MDEKEFEQYLRRTKEVLKLEKLDDIGSRMARLSGWIGGSKDKLFTGDQIRRLFDLAFTE